MQARPFRKIFLFITFRDQPPIPVVLSNEKNEHECIAWSFFHHRSFFYFSRVQQVPLSVILRTPIEVWVSCGENFVRPKTAEKLYEANLRSQHSRNAENLILDTGKHTLRHMQGR